MNVPRYQDFRLSYPLIVVIVILEIICIHNIFSSGVNALNVFLVVVLAIFCLLFYSWSIDVNADSIFISYGVGLFDMEVELHEITGYRIGNNRNFLSWLYNPLGSSSLGVSLRSGGVLHLPTDNPKMLQQATQSDIKKRSGKVERKL